MAKKMTSSSKKSRMKILKKQNYSKQMETVSHASLEILDCKK